MMQPKDSERTKGYWGGVVSMSLCVALLIASEFMPVSLLTPMAHDLGATEGQVGQAIGISGLFAVIASLAITTVAGRLNRKTVLLCVTIVMLLSLLLMSLAQNVTVLVVSRILLGLCIGGFWALSTAVIMRLVPAEKVSRALTIMYTGQAFAAAFAAPIGSYLGGLIGWRGVFALLVPIIAVNALWHWRALPSLPAKSWQSPRQLLTLLKRGYFRRGLASVILTFAGAFTMYTYLRPFLETITQVSVNTLSLVFLLLGSAGFVGTWVGGMASRHYCVQTLRAVPISMALITAGLLWQGHQLFAAAALLALWGALNTAMPIAWMSWLSQNMDDAPEAAGSLIVAAIQAAIMFGATLGGLLIDSAGIRAAFIGSIVLSSLAVLAIGSGQALNKST